MIWILFSIYFLLSSSGFIHQTTGKYQLFNVRKCNDSITFFNLDLHHSLVINGSFINNQVFESSCRFSFISKNIKSYDMILFNLQSFETSSFGQTKSIAALLFSAQGKGLFQFNIFDTDMVFRNMFVTALLIERNFHWKDQLNVDLRIIGPGVTSLVFVINPGHYCSSNHVDNDLFKCEDGYKEYNICISNYFKCNGWNNCPYHETDESQLTCHSQFIHHILIPSLILSCTVFVLGWVLLKITPCLLEQRRLFLIRRSHLLLSTVTSATLGGRNGTQFFQSLPFGRRSSENNLTPENIPNSPPKYQNIYHPSNSVDHQLPPSYSEDVDIAVIPDFFKRFFGKVRTKLQVENPENNVFANSERIKNNLDSQSDADNQFATMNKRDKYSLPSDSDTLTSITSTDVFWSVPNFVNPDRSNNKNNKISSSN